MQEKKKLLSEQEREELSSHIIVIRGLVNYHKRMVATLNELPCGDGEKCPVLDFENDLYLKALEVSLELLEREFVERS